MNSKLLFGSAIDLSLETIVNLPTYVNFQKEEDEEEEGEKKRMINWIVAHRKINNSLSPSPVILLLPAAAKIYV